jgi:hypothetical protein
MSTKLFSGFTYNITTSLSKLLNKDFSGRINQKVLDNLNEVSNVEELDVSDEIKTPYIVNTKKLFEVTYGRVDKNISRLKSKKNKYKVQIQYNFEQYKQYLPHTKIVSKSVNNGTVTTNTYTKKANTLRDAITVRNKIRKGLPGRITVHDNGVRKIENTHKDSVKSSKSTISASLQVGVNFNNKAVDKYGRKFSYFWALFKTPEGKFKSKAFSVGGHLDMNDIILNRAKQLAIAVRNEYEWHLVNSIPYYIDNTKFKGWQKMSELEFMQLIDIRMKKLVS